MANQTYMPPALGTVLKIGVTANIGNDMHLSDVDFTCTFFNKNGSSSQNFQKSEMTYLDDDNYMAVVDTTKMGTGKYYARLTVMVPDDNVIGGIREEVVSFPTNIYVVN